jgi:hypothetical protein
MKKVIPKTAQKNVDNDADEHYLEPREIEYEYNGHTELVLPLDAMKTGVIYKGQCRNAVHAYWNGKKFIHQRYKMGTTFLEDINHPVNDTRFDVFLVKCEADETDADVIELRNAINNMTDQEKEWYCG